MVWKSAKTDIHERPLHFNDQHNSCAKRKPNINMMIHKQLRYNSFIWQIWIFLQARFHSSTRGTKQHFAYTRGYVRWFGNRFHVTCWLLLPATPRKGGEIHCEAMFRQDPSYIDWFILGANLRTRTITSSSPQCRWFAKGQVGDF